MGSARWIPESGKLDPDIAGSGGIAGSGDIASSGDIAGAVRTVPGGGGVIASAGA